MATSTPMGEIPLDLVIRFSSSNPDVVLSIAHPSRTTGLTLKQKIREPLNSPAKESRLRLIHAGKVLGDEQSLGRSLGAAATVLPPVDEDGGKAKAKSEKAKGKMPVRDAEDEKESSKRRARVYIHCSVGDALTPAELEDEARRAKEADEALVSNTGTIQPGSQGQGTENATSQSQSSTTTPAPRGFDRLLTAGFTPAEVAQLRTQFLAIQAHTHTPDTMPSGPDLLRLEEQWLDSGSGATGEGGGGDTGGFGSEDSGGLEDMLWGNLIGFFWPVGAMFWLMREEGVWTQRRRVAVLTGFLVNITFGFLRVMM
jgi:hypothetical protein